MKFTELTKKRKTTFDFSNKSVPDKAIYEMLDAARWSPSCTNSQPWEFIIVKDKKRINDLMKHVNYGFFHSNPNVLIACLLKDDRCRGPNHSCFRNKDSGVHDTYMSVGMAAFSITLAAAELRIDSCLLTPDQQPVKKILKADKKDAVPLLVGLGYENKKAFKRERKRIDLKKLIHQEVNE